MLLKIARMLQTKNNVPICGQYKIAIYLVDGAEVICSVFFESPPHHLFLILLSIIGITHSDFPKILK
jgi:hypothetical protein